MRLHAEHEFFAFDSGLDGFRRELRHAGDVGDGGGDRDVVHGVEHDAGVRAERDLAGGFLGDEEGQVDVGEVDEVEHTTARVEDFADFGDAVLDAFCVGLCCGDGGFGLDDGGLVGNDRGFDALDIGFGVLDIGFGGVDVGACGLEHGLVVFEGLAGRDVLFHQFFRTFVTALCVIVRADLRGERGFRGGERGFRGGESGFLDLELRLGLFELGFSHLDGGVCLCEFGVKRIGLHLGERLACLHIVAFVDQNLFDFARELGSDIDLGRLKTAVAGGERRIPVDGFFFVGLDEIPGHADRGDDEERDDDLFHGFWDPFSLVLLN